MVSENHVPERRTATAWAPWWVYLVVILGANYLRQAVLPLGTVPEWAVVLFVIGISAVLFIAITAIYRATTRRSTPAR